MNCSGIIDVSLGYKTYRILVRLEHLEVLKYIFFCNFHDIYWLCQVSHYTTIIYIILKITIGYYKYNINS